MRYENVKEAAFLSRPNRFIAHVRLEGKEEIVHVKNTGRCRELLLPGARVILAAAGKPLRKTRYDLIAVYREGRLINIDSQAPNRAALEYLQSSCPQGTFIRPEYRHGNSRLDFYLESPEGRRSFIEVKGVTLLEGDVALFPDAPTSRGAKHLRELAACAGAGDDAMLLFILQMKGARCLRPNDRTDPAFGEALRSAAAAGVRLRALDCRVLPDGMEVDKPLPVEL